MNFETKHTKESVSVTNIAGYDNPKHFLNEFDYFVEFDIELETFDDIFEVFDGDMKNYRTRIMNIPSKEFDGELKITVRIDLENLDEIENLAEFLYDQGYIDDDGYENFEDEFVSFY